MMREQSGSQAGGKQHGLSPVSSPGWFHLVTPSDSTLCIERIKVFGGVYRVFYLIITRILMRKA